MHAFLRATLDWSYELLTEPERVILRRLGVFAGAFSIEAVRAVVTGADLTALAAIDGITSLVAKSLVQAEGTARLRYRLLDTTRAYALEKLESSGELQEVAHWHADYYRDVFERAEAEWQTRQAKEWLADYGPKIDNLRAALDWAFSPGGEPSIAVALTAAAVPLWTQLSLLEECRGRVERALAALEAGASRDARHEMKLHAALGASLIYTRGPVPETGLAWTTALEIAENLDDVEYRLRSLRGLWFFDGASSRHRVALALAERFCALAANRPDPNDRLISERMIGISQHFLGDQTAARQHLERFLARYTAPGHRSIIRFGADLQVMTRTHLARILWLQGCPDQAVRAADSSIDDARAANHATSMCHALTLAACPIKLWTGDLTAAES